MIENDRGSTHVMEGCEIFTRNMGRWSSSLRVGFIMRWWEIVSLFTCKGVLSPLFHEPPTPTILPTPLFQVLSNPPPPNPTNTHCSFCCSVSLAEWVITPHLMCYLLNDNMDLHQLGFYAKSHQVYWGLTNTKFGF